MVRVLLILLHSFFPFTASAASLAEIDQFLNSRQLVTQVFFAKQTSELSDLSKQQLNRIASQLADYENQHMLIRVEGFASSDGSDQYNMQLSLKRALTVAEYLLQNHKLSIPVFLTGLGEIKQSTAKLAKMRRVDIAVYKKNPAAEALFDDKGKSERFILR